MDADCTYLLTQDFVDQNFTLVLKNDEDRTLSVKSGGYTLSVNIEGQVKKYFSYHSKRYLYSEELSK